MKHCCANCGWLEANPISAMFCGYSNKHTWEDESCLAWKPKDEPKTNADRIRAMTDEELADFIGGIFTVEHDVYGAYDPRTVVMQEPRVEVRDRDEMLDWLREEVEE